jgi:hypothetical protein
MKLLYVFNERAQELRRFPRQSTSRRIWVCQRGYAFIDSTEGP